MTKYYLVQGEELVLEVLSGQITYKFCIFTRKVSINKIVYFFFVLFSPLIMMFVCLMQISFHLATILFLFLENLIMF